MAFSGWVSWFCGQVKHAVFSWYLERPSNVAINVRSLYAAALGQCFLSSRPDRFLSKALFSPFIEKIPICLLRLPVLLFGHRADTGADRDIRAIFPGEGLMLHRSPDPPHAHFSTAHYRNDLDEAPLRKVSSCASANSRI
jgi:hypothetical protein